MEYADMASLGKWDEAAGPARSMAGPYLSDRMAPPRVTGRAVTFEQAALSRVQ